MGVSVRPQLAEAGRKVYIPSGRVDGQICWKLTNGDAERYIITKKALSIKGQAYIQDPHPAPLPFLSNKSGATPERQSYPTPAAENGHSGAGPKNSGLYYRTQESKTG